MRSGQQVGYGSSSPYPYSDAFSYQLSQALVWAGTADSVVNLHPNGYSSSQALATNGTQQGGWATDALTLNRHAMMWSGTAASAVDLHAAGYTDTRITAMTATQQVGDGWTLGAPGAAGSIRHALVWSGTPGSAVDLNQYLPPGYKHAVATGIDAAGNVVGCAYNTQTVGLTMPPDAIAVVFAPGQSGPGRFRAWHRDVGRPGAVGHHGYLRGRQRRIDAGASSAGDSGWADQRHVLDDRRWRGSPGSGLHPSLRQ